jgi:diguanylate cyclase (GGDEF)-like protein
VGPAEEAGQKQDVLRRAALAVTLVAVLATQRSHVPAWPAVAAALASAFVYDLFLGYLVFVARRYMLARVLAFLLDATLMFVALMFVLKSLGDANSSSDIWVAMLLFIGSGGLALAPIGSLIYTALGTGAFILGTLLYFPSDSQYHDELAIRVAFFIAFGLLALGAAQEMEKRRKRVLEQNSALAESKLQLEEKSRLLERALALERERARHDQLTGALNHAAIVEELRGLVAAQRRDNEGLLAVAMVDVDGLKGINDTFGHPMGDAVLEKVGRVLALENALVGRYGGDEFVVILPSATRSDAERYRRGVFSALDDVHLVDEDTGARIPVSVSIGVVCFPQEAGTIEDLIKLSDSAMYASRRMRAIAVGLASDDRDPRTTAVLSEILPLMTAPGDISSKLQLVAKRVARAAGYAAVDIRLGDSDRSVDLQVSFANAAKELLQEWKAEQQSDENSYAFVNILARTGRPLLLDDLEHDERLSSKERAILAAGGLRSALMVPMLWQGELLGAISVASRSLSAFGPRDAEFMTSVAAQATAIVRMSVVLEELRATSKRLQDAHVETVMLLASAAEAHDATTGRHLHGIRVITEILARELGYSEERATELALASTLHDIGKIRVPDSVLANSAELTQNDWKVMKQHTVWGADFLASRPELAEAAAIAQAHHERWDGTGYPDGLTGEEIPESAMIVSVADAFDALTSDRPYRRGRGVDKAVAEIVSCSGTQFSPCVVDALVRIAKRGELAHVRKRRVAAAA